MSSDNPASIAGVTRRLMHTGEVEIREVYGHGRRVVLRLVREAVRQAGKISPAYASAS
jgi:hypothetical protein